MIRDITLGQYYAAELSIYRLDSRVKILAAVLFIIELFFIRGFAGLGVCAAALAVAVAVSKVPLTFIMRGLKPILLEQSRPQRPTERYRKPWPPGQHRCHCRQDPKHQAHQQMQQRLLVTRTNRLAGRRSHGLVPLWFWRC